VETQSGGQRGAAIESSLVYDLPYTTGHLVRQYLMTVRTVCILALPNGSFTAPSPVETRHRVTAEYA
jgi:hypothetical protein